MSTSAELLGVVDPTKGESSRSLLGRVALILDAFDWQHPVLSLGDLTHITGLPKSTVHRLCDQLVQVGWLERSYSGYRIGMRMFEVGGLVERRNRVRDCAAIHLHQLAVQTMSVVHLGVLDRGEVLCLSKVVADEFEIPTHEGGRLPAHCTGLGKALLAFAEDEEVEHAVARGLERLTENTIVDEERLYAELEAVRRRGFALDREEAGLGHACVAAPIRGSGRAIAAVSATLTVGHLDAGSRAVETAVRSAAASIWNDMFSGNVSRGPRSMRNGCDR
jgi:DNA-binding IclR family transcriptional regulator